VIFSLVLNWRLTIGGSSVAQVSVAVEQVDVGSRAVAVEVLKAGVCCCWSHCLSYEDVSHVKLQAGVLLGIQGVQLIDKVQNPWVMISCIKSLNLIAYPFVLLGRAL